jgi:hypothetical protein
MLHYIIYDAFIDTLRWRYRLTVPAPISRDIPLIYDVLLDGRWHETYFDVN